MDFESLKNKAVIYTQISKKTEKEVILKLKKLSASENEIIKIIKILNDLNYINDNEYVDAYIRQNMRLLRFSIYEIKSKLLQKGINKDIIETKLDVLNNSDYENTVINKIINSKYKVDNVDNLSKEEYIKFRSYIYRRGFKTEYNLEDN